MISNIEQVNICKFHLLIPSCYYIHIYIYIIIIYIETPKLRPGFKMFDLFITWGPQVRW